MRHFYITRAQRVALWKLFCRKYSVAYEGNREVIRHYRAFRRQAFKAFGDCVMVQMWGMTLGIESDGYTHS